jgi:hypothetical protein
VNLKDFELEYATYKSTKDELFSSLKWSDEEIHQYELWLKISATKLNNMSTLFPPSPIITLIQKTFGSVDQEDKKLSTKQLSYLELREKILLKEKLKDIEDHLKDCFEFYNNLPCLAQKIMVFISCVESLPPMGFPYIEFPDNALLSIHLTPPQIPERREIRTIVAITIPSEGWTDDHRKRFKEQYNQDPIDFIAIQEADKKARQEKMEREIQQATLACDTLKEIHKDFSLLAHNPNIHFHQLKVNDYLCDYLLWLPLLDSTLENHPLIKLLFEPYTLLFPEAFKSNDLWLSAYKKEFIDKVDRVRHTFITLLTKFKQAHLRDERKYASSNPYEIRTQPA